jgi:hypothetical protein
MKIDPAILALLQAAVLLILAPVVLADEPTRLDDLLFKGTHNSYHKRPYIPIHPRHRYEHDRLLVQLELHGVRAMELDLHLNGSGDLEVYHIAVIDGRSHCKAFRRCLGELRLWSDMNPEHEPLMIWLEVKDFAGGREIESLLPVEAEIRDMLGDRLITPDDVRGAHESLRSALAAEGWPSLEESRGKVMFMMTGSDEHRRDYTSGFSHLDGRVMFVEAKVLEISMPWAAVAKLGLSDPELFESAQAAHVLLTTTVCVAEMNDAECYRDRDNALAAGINILLDDYVRPTPDRNYFLDVDFRRVAHRDVRRDDTLRRQGSTSVDSIR